MKIEIPKKRYSYTDYKVLLESLLSEGKVTGDQQSESLLEYTKLNMHRLHRWEKTFSPNAVLAKRIAMIDKPMNWVIITEGWCGDAAQQVPVIEKLASLNPAITTHYVLRDDNPDFMNLFLTNGGKSIPVWICADENWEFQWKWGPRPNEAAQLLKQLKESGIDDSLIKQELHGWYAKNKQVALQSEIEQLLAHDSISIG
jgi:hypothetical protein